jgi:hypothetical protein
MVRLHTVEIAPHFAAGILYVLRGYLRRLFRKLSQY